MFFVSLVQNAVFTYRIPSWLKVLKTIQSRWVLHMAISIFRIITYTLTTLNLKLFFFFFEGLLLEHFLLYHLYKRINCILLFCYSIIAWQLAHFLCHWHAAWFFSVCELVSFEAKRWTFHFSYMILLTCCCVEWPWIAIPRGVSHCAVTLFAWGFR